MLEYLTVAEVRAAHGADVAEQTDAQLQQTLDNLADELETALGHGFGRAVRVWAASALTVAVTTTGVTLAGGATSDTFPFADYPTLGELADAIVDADLGVTCELLRHVPTTTPSTLLRAMAATACGPTYDLRQVLEISELYVGLTAVAESHLFLPLPVASVTSVVEEGVTLASTAYWLSRNDPWLIRKACSCTTVCNHGYARWRAHYPNNVQVIYRPRFWRQIPGALRSVAAEAFTSHSGLTAFTSETFGTDYSYRRETAVEGAGSLLGGSRVRPYAVRFMP